MNIYLAARSGRRDELCGYAERLRSRGHRVTSRWLVRAPLLGTQPETAQAGIWAQEDLADVRAADVVVAFTQDPLSITGHGGRHVELGAALALKRKVVVVGPRENIFCCLPGVEQYDTWEDALATSKLLQPRPQRRVPPFAGRSKGAHRGEGPPTSIAAAQAIAPLISEMQRAIYCWLLAHGPATDKQVHADPQFRHYDQRTPQVRRRELVQMGYVEDSGETAPVGPRTRAILWRAIPPELLDAAQRAALGPDVGPQEEKEQAPKEQEPEQGTYQQLSFG